MTTHPTTPVVIERIPYDAAAWAAIAAGHPEAEVFHEPAWLAYLVDTQGIEIVTAQVRQDGRTVGHFVGGLVRRYGLRILGTPMSGWGTPRLGFLLEPGADRTAAAIALLPFAFRDLGCVHVELGDEGLAPEAMAGTGYQMEAGRTFLVDLRQTEEEILSGMRASTRNYVRQGQRKGLTVQRASGEAFADEFHAQLTDVFAHKGLKPTYSAERVRALIRHLEPTGQLLLLRVVDPKGVCIATSVVVGNERRAVLWGAAFLRSRSDLHPNEILHWEEMRHWRSRGTLLFDFGGGGEYKLKFGGVETPSRRYLAYRFGVLRRGRDAARGLFRRRQALGRQEPAVPEEEAGQAPAAETP